MAVDLTGTLSSDSILVGRFLHLLQDASKVSRKIRSYMRHRAKQRPPCLHRAADVECLCGRHQASTAWV